jgi:hypothetical protein
MKDGKCAKNYPRKLIKETQIGNDGYPLYGRRAPEDGKFMATQKQKSPISGLCHFCHYCQKYFRLTSTWSTATV